MFSFYILKFCYANSLTIRCAKILEYVAHIKKVVSCRTCRHYHLTPPPTTTKHNPQNKYCPNRATINLPIMSCAPFSANLRRSKVFWCIPLGFIIIGSARQSASHHSTPISKRCLILLALRHIRSSSPSDWLA